MFIDLPNSVKQRYGPYLMAHLSLPEAFIDGLPIFFLTFITCNIIFFLSSIISPALFPNSYSKLTRFQKLNWNVHVVSQFNCIIMSYLAVQVLLDGGLGHDPYTKVLGRNDFATGTYALSMG